MSASGHSPYYRRMDNVRSDMLYGKCCIEKDDMLYRHAVWNVLDVKDLECIYVNVYISK